MLYNKKSLWILPCFGDCDRGGYDDDDDDDDDGDGNDDDLRGLMMIIQKVNIYDAGETQAFCSFVH